MSTEYRSTALWSHHNPGSRDYGAHFTGEEKEAQADSETCPWLPRQSVATLGPRLKSLSGKAMPLPLCAWLLQSVSLITLELLSRVVSTPSLEAFRQLFIRYWLDIPDSWAGGEVRQWVGSFQLHSFTRGPTGSRCFASCKGFGAASAWLGRQQASSCEKSRGHR